MKIIFNFILTIVLFLSPTLVMAATSSAPSTQQANSADVTTFKQSMQKAIDDQKEKIKLLRGIVFNLKEPVVPGAGDKLVNATLMFDVKAALYKNFIDNPVSQDAQVQAKLLRIMNQSIITESDLKELQQAADDARTRKK